MPCIPFSSEDIKASEPDHKPPPRVWVYWCKNCGKPVLADVRKDVDVECPECPFTKGADMGVTRYAIVERRRKAGAA